MSNHGTDERGWPLVPVDPMAIPKGHEPVRVGWAFIDELVSDWSGMAKKTIDNTEIRQPPHLIIRPIKPPIELPLSIVPHGWWVAKDKDGWVCLHEKETRISAGGLTWFSDGQIWQLPPWIAAQLPAEWHELPWDQSATQQTRGGDT